MRVHRQVLAFFICAVPEEKDVEPIMAFANTADKDGWLQVPKDVALEWIEAINLFVRQKSGITDPVVRGLNGEVTLTKLGRAVLEKLADNKGALH